MAIATLGLVRELEVLEISPATGLDADRIVVDLERHHGQAMFGFVRRQGLSDAEAQDAVQEALLRLWREIRDGASIDNPRAWAYRAIFRIGMDQHRLRRRLAGIAERLDLGRVAPSPESAGDRQAVWLEVDRLPARQREVLYLRYRSDLAYEEIGRILGITASAARSHATQAMATLRGRLEREDFE